MIENSTEGINRELCKFKRKLHENYVTNFTMNFVLNLCTMSLITYIMLNE